AEREQLGRGAAGIAPVALPTEHRPYRTGRLRLATYVRQCHEADRQIAIIRREQAEQVEIPLRHDCERNAAQGVDAVSEVQPLVVLLASQPLGGELDQLGSVERQELHGRVPERE